MNKKFKILLLLSILLFVISSIVILINGKTYVTEFIVNDKEKSHYKIDLKNYTGEVKIIEEKKIKNKYLVKVTAVKPGKATLYLNFGDYTQGKSLYVHKTMVITEDTFFGNSTYSRIIPISISIILLYSLYLLINKYKKSMKENIYQYKNVAYLGIIIFVGFFTLDNIISIFNYHGIFETVNKVINSMSFISLFLFPIAVITFILVTISNIVLIKREGKSLKNLLGLFLGIFICILTILPNSIYGILQRTQVIDIYNLNSIGPYLYNFIEALVYLTVAYLECVLISTIIIAIKVTKKKIEYNKDYMIILGCKIKKNGTLTPLLKGRVDKAIEFRNRQLEVTGKDLIFIPSGGKGTDEIISEAEAMKNYLIEEGINKKNIIIDNKSKNTEENIKFSNNLIKQKDANIAFSTTNYHVFRVGLMATKQGLLLEGIGSKTKTYFWINAFIREFIGTLYSERKKHILVIILIIFILIIMIGITYLANNI